VLLKLRPNSYELVAAATACIVLISLPTRAQNTKDLKLDQGSSEMLKSADTAFAMKAAQDGVAETRMGKLAAEKANGAGIKALGQEIAADCTKANDDLKSVAEKKGMTLPTNMTAHQYAVYRKLQKLSGLAFDRAYLKVVVKDNRDAVKEFQKEANGGKDEDIKRFASRTLPLLETHLHGIQSIQSDTQQSGSFTK
jgi:putative membrane protein